MRYQSDRSRRSHGDILPARRRRLCRDTRRHPAREGPMHGVLRGLFGSVRLLLLTSAIASAQQGSTGQISGTVKDTSGGVMPGADVSATQIETGFKRTVVTDGTGAYTLTNP